MGELVKDASDNITYKIIGLAMDVHKRLGPGLKERIYQKAMEGLLRGSDLNYEPQKRIEIYLGKRLAGLLFIDVLVEDSIVCEFKALSHPVTNVEIAQVITYLKAKEAKVGLLINFGRKFLEFKRIFPPRKISEITEEDLRFGVKFKRNNQKADVTGQVHSFIR